MTNITEHYILEYFFLEGRVKGLTEEAALSYAEERYTKEFPNGHPEPNSTKPNNKKD